MKKNIYRKAYNIFDDAPDEDPKFFDLNIWDMFPHDHKLLDEEDIKMGDDARAMEKELSEVI